MTSPTIRQYENISEGSVKPETQKHQQINTGFYEPVNTQLELSATIHEDEGTGHYENRAVRGKGGAVNDNQRHYENAAFDNQNKIVNMYEGLQIRTEDHAYADLENN